MKQFSAPHAVGAPDDVLELARSVVDADAAAVLSNPSNEISCKAGCSACCSQAVPVRLSEVRSILAYIEVQSTSRRHVLRRRRSDAVKDLAAAGIEASGLPVPTNTARADFVNRYFAAQIPCPMLDADGTCGIRPARPLACREYLVSSDPKYCATPGHEQVVRLRSRRDALSGFHQISTLFGEGHVGLLAFSLTDQVAAPPTTRPRSGASIVRILTTRYAHEG